MSLSEGAFHRLDLNLMRVFITVYRELNVSKAARHLEVTQPAVSGSLVRLRNYFGDPLFERVTGGVRPTEKARQIAELLLPAMEQIEFLLAHNRDKSS